MTFLWNFYRTKCSKIKVISLWKEKTLKIWCLNSLNTFLALFTFFIQSLLDLCITYIKRIITIPKVRFAIRGTYQANFNPGNMIWTTNLGIWKTKSQFPVFGLFTVYPWLFPLLSLFILFCYHKTVWIIKCFEATEKNCISLRQSLVFLSPETMPCCAHSWILANLRPMTIINFYQ